MNEDESPTGEDRESDVFNIAGIIGVVPKVAEPRLKQELPCPLKETSNQVQSNE